MRSVYKKGFTIPEMIIVIGIISIFAAIVLAGYSQYREKARDGVREVDIDRLAVTMRLYMEQYGSEIDCEGGLKIDGSMSIETIAADGCADAAQILDFIAADFGRIPVDPKGPGDADYFYYYDNSHLCDAAGGTAAMLFAVNLEHEDSNAGEVCGVVEGNDGGYLSTNDYGGTINQSKPYVRLVHRAQQR